MDGQFDRTVQGADPRARLDQIVARPRQDTPVFLQPLPITSSRPSSQTSSTEFAAFPIPVAFTARDGPRHESFAPPPLFSPPSTAAFSRPSSTSRGTPGIRRDNENTLARLQMSPHAPMVTTLGRMSSKDEATAANSLPYMGVFRPGYPGNFSVLPPSSHERANSSSKSARVRADNGNEGSEDRVKAEYESPNVSVADSSLTHASTFLQECQTSPLQTLPSRSSEGNSASSKPLLHTDLGSKNSPPFNMVAPPERGIPGVVKPLKKGGKPKRKSVARASAVRKSATPGVVMPLTERERHALPPAAPRIPKVVKPLPTKRSQNNAPKSEPSHIEDTDLQTGRRTRRRRAALPDFAALVETLEARPVKTSVSRTSRENRRNERHCLQRTATVKDEPTGSGVDNDTQAGQSVGEAAQPAVSRRSARFRERREKLAAVVSTTTAPAAAPARTSSEKLGDPSATTEPSVVQRKKPGRKSNGCWTCKLRRKACDGRRPGCEVCEKLKLHCHGYAVDCPAFMADPVEKERQRELIRITRNTRFRKVGVGHRAEA